jgi:hypothetical protein
MWLGARVRRALARTSGPHPARFGSAKPETPLRAACTTSRRLRALPPPFLLPHPHGFEGFGLVCGLTGRRPVPRFEARGVDAESPAHEDAVAGMRHSEPAARNVVAGDATNEYSAADARQVRPDPPMLTPGHIATAELRRSTGPEPATAEKFGAIVPQRQRRIERTPTRREFTHNSGI